MKGKSKPFSPGLHRTHDPKSRRIVKEFFAENGIVLVDHPNQFDIDLTTEDGKIRVEVEHRMSWNKRVFPFDEVNVPQRKEKFFKEGNTHYVILSKDYSVMGFLDAKIVQKYMKPKHLKESKNRFVEEDEFFYKVPKDEFEFYELHP